MLSTLKALTLQIMLRSCLNLEPKWVSVFANSAEEWSGGKRSSHLSLVWAGKLLFSPLHGNQRASSQFMFMLSVRVVLKCPYAHFTLLSLTIKHFSLSYMKYCVLRPCDRADSVRCECGWRTTEFCFRPEVNYHHIILIVMLAWCKKHSNCFL